MQLSQMTILTGLIHVYTWGASIYLPRENFPRSVCVSLRQPNAFYFDFGSCQKITYAKCLIRETVIQNLYLRTVSRVIVPYLSANGHIVIFLILLRVLPTADFSLAQEGLVHHLS